MLVGRYLFPGRHEKELQIIERPHVFPDGPICFGELDDPTLDLSDDIRTGGRITVAVPGKVDVDREEAFDIDPCRLLVSPIFADAFEGLIAHEKLRGRGAPATRAGMGIEEFDVEAAESADMRGDQSARRGRRLDSPDRARAWEHPQLETWQRCG